MKIENEVVQIKSGDKTFTFKNRILDAYIQCFVLSQFENTPIEYQENKALMAVLLKFDNPLPQKYEYNSKEFDVCSISTLSYKETKTQDQITVKYEYDLSEVGSFTSGMKDIKEFLGRKITAIGFTFGFIDSMLNNTSVKAILDTKSQNLYVNENMSITRLDTITTNKKFYSKDISFPFHLSPTYDYQNNKKWVSKIVSIGFSNFLDKIDTEIPISSFVERNYNDTSFYGFVDTSSFSGKTAFHPSVDTMVGVAVPLETQQKYFVIKYKIYEYDSNTSTYRDLNKSYLLYDELKEEIEEKAHFSVKYIIGGK